MTFICDSFFCAYLTIYRKSTFVFGSQVDCSMVFLSGSFIDDPKELCGAVFSPFHHFSHQITNCISRSIGIKVFFLIHFRCINRFGTFDCRCLAGYGDPFIDDPEKAGRFCQSCSADYCHGRGTCSIESGDVKVCL